MRVALVIVAVAIGLGLPGFMTGVGDMAGGASAAELDAPAHDDGRDAALLLAQAAAPQASSSCERDADCTDQSKPKCCCEQRFAGYMCLCQASCGTD